MISPSLIRQQSALLARKPLSRTCLLLPKTHFRGKHYKPALSHGNIFEQDGVNGMLSPAGFDLAWTQYQEYLVTTLNQMTYGTPDDGAKVKDLLIKYARDGQNATLFNYASMAYNNHFMFSTLTPYPEPPSKTMIQQIELSSLSSLPTLRETFIATAAAMFGPGFTWLIKRNNDGKLSILNTYLAGSPFPGAHHRGQHVDAASTPGTALPGALPAWQIAGTGRYAGQPGLTAGAMGAWSKRQLAPGGVELDVLMCVNTWEHCWLMDWGIGGKRGYLEAWWDSIDWGVVEANAGWGTRDELRRSEQDAREARETGLSESAG